MRGDRRDSEKREGERHKVRRERERQRETGVGGERKEVESEERCRVKGESNRGVRELRGEC